MAQISIKDMLDAGVHFGHQTQRWNPKMKPYVYTARGGIHIIDLQKTISRAKTAAEFVRSVSANGGRMIFVGTKKQAIEPVQKAANSCGQFYITKRWLGGTLTNFSTIKSSIDRLKKIDHMREKGELDYFSKKERSKIEKEYVRLNEYLSGIRDMKEPPSAMFVIDLNKEHIAVAEAQKLGIPVIGIADTNVNPEEIEFPIPGNDDAIRSIRLFSTMVAEAYMEGTKEWEVKSQSLAKEAEKEVEQTQKQTAAVAKSDGPAVVKVGDGRRLVAAGLADEVEILEELEKGSEEPAEDAAEETPAKPTEKK